VGTWFNTQKTSSTLKKLSQKEVLSPKKIWQTWMGDTKNKLGGMTGRLRVRKFELSCRNAWVSNATGVTD
jgi:hypothetical protein